jgi:serine/threonine-protein kinase
MPDIVNWELSQAERALNNLGLNLQLKLQKENHDDVPEGSVIRTEPVAEEDLATGQEVTLYVSLGMEMKVGTMPDVVGDKLDSAKKILESQELNLQIVEEQLYDSEVAAGDVIRTEPEVGMELTTGQTVTLYVSQGAQLATMPNVVGMSISNAYSVLNTEGFVTPNIVYVDSKAVKDEVVSQSVEKNTKVDVNTQITLEVSKGSVPLVTKEVKVKVPTGMENASIAVISPNGAPAQFVVSGQSSAEVTLRITGSGKGTYTVNFTDYDADEQASVDVEVDFDK